VLDIEHNEQFLPQRWQPSGLQGRVVWQKFTDVLEVLTASIIRAMRIVTEAASASETSVTHYQSTRPCSPEDSQPLTLFCESLKACQVTWCCCDSGTRRYALVEENACRLVGGKINLLKKCPLGKPRRRWKNNILYSHAALTAVLPVMQHSSTLWSTNEWKIRKRGGGGGKNRGKFQTVKVTRQCPVVLQVKVRSR
jgi:hypothetical protein